MKINIYLILIFFCSLNFTTQAQNKPSIQLGNFKKLSTINHIIYIDAANAKIAISCYNATIIRVRANQTTFATDSSMAVIKTNTIAFKNLTENAAEIVLKTDSLTLKISKNPIRLQFCTANGDFINGDEADLGITWLGDKVYNYKTLGINERFVGLGEKTGNLNRRGSSYTNWNSDVPAYALNADPLYKTLPFYISLNSGKTYGLFFDNTHKSYFNFGASTDEKYMFFGADGGEMNYYFFGSQSVVGLLKDYTYLTGRMEMPPLWSIGYTQSRWSYHPDKQVITIAQTFRQKQIPIDALYLDIDYMDNYKIFTWNPTEFANPKGMIDQLKAMNLHVVTIVDPGIKIEKGYKQYDEGIAKGYFATYPNGSFYVGSVWPGHCHFPDYYRPEVRKWWGSSFTALTQMGVDGFWNDMNEPAAWGQNIPDIIEFGETNNKVPLSTVRNAYGLQMAKATQEGVKQIRPNQRPFVLTRAAYAGVQRYSAVWTGDNFASNDHMLLGQRLVNSTGLSGVANVGVDVGGFMGTPTPQLMVRWNALGVYTPMFRNHAEINSNWREPWRFGAENEKLIKKDIEFRYQLLPYIYASFYQAHQTGLPVARSLAINYPWDNNIYNSAYQNQFLFGDNLLVCPTASDSLTTKVYLPPGGWYRLSTDQFFSGNKELLNVASPLADLPVYVKASAIIPMQNVVQSTAEKGDGILKINVWYGNQGSNYTYYEDDGTTYNYQKQEFYKRLITFAPSKKQIIFGAAEGNYLSKYTKIELILHGFKNKFSTFIVNGKAIKLYPNQKNDTAYATFQNNKQNILVQY